MKLRLESQRSGFALLTVLLVLLALLVLCAPFLMTARNTSKASTQLADRAQARLALDSAIRNARSQLGQSHIGLDASPYFDDEAELFEFEPLDRSFLDAGNDRGVMFGAEIDDVAASVDLNSAPPQLFANLLGVTARLVEPLKDNENGEITVSSTFGFPPAGFLWVEDELIGYSQLDPQHFKKLVRGIGGRKDEEGAAIPCGPQPSKSHVAGTVVIEQRAFAPVLWRNETPDGVTRAFDAPEQLRDCAQLALGLDAAADFLAQQRADEDPKADLEALRAEERRAAVENFIAPFVRYGSVYSGVRAGRQWQRPVRVLTPIEGGKTCRIEVDETRWFAPGTTVRITDGQTVELGLVQRVDVAAIYLADVLDNSYFVGQAQIQALVRRPVNVNTANEAVLTALFTNLAIRRINDRITRDEAKALAQLVIESRPFDGFEDFVRRIVLPAAGLAKLPPDAPVVPDALAQGGRLIDPWDAVALHANALNSNDSLLAYSTMPLCFTTRDVYRIQARALVNAPSGVERARALREQVELVTPQRELMQVWARQEDFDEAARLDLNAPWWATGPNATSRRDGYFPAVNLGPGAQGVATPPSRLLAHLGANGQMLFGGGSATPAAGGAGTAATPDPSSLPSGDPIAASREDDGWAALWPTRVPDNVGLGVRNVMHFDHETRDPEGRFLPDGTIVKNANANDVGWVAANSPPPLLGAFHFSGWFKPQALSAGQTLFDVGRSSLELDRVALEFDGTDLVLRVFDATGDHLGTAGFVEAGEARYALAATGDDPGLPANTWSHIAVDVRGTRANQIALQVDGRSIGVRTLGMTRLSSALSDTATTINVESTEGFGATGSPVVLRIGNELIEATISGPRTFQASWDANQQFGGRLARVPFQINGAPTANGVAELGLLQSTRLSHASGVAVHLYGYADPLWSNVPGGGGNLRAPLGLWTVGRVAAPASGNGDQISMQGLPIGLGTGLEANSSINALQLEPVDGTLVSGAQLAAAFNQGTDGGYAVLIQKQPPTISAGPPGQPPTVFTTTVSGTGAPLMGAEIVRYSSVTVSGTGAILTISQRAALPAILTQQQAHAFVIQWTPGFNVAGTPLNELLDWQLFVAPISIPESGGGGATGFPIPLPGTSELVQLGGANTPAANTEWVRYDSIQQGHLVRNDRNALQALVNVLTLPGLVETPDITLPPGGPGGGGPFILAPNAPAPTPTPAASAPLATAQGASANWQAIWGVEEDLNWPVTRAARTAFQFRGVFGTHTHIHAVNTPVLPVWRVRDVGMALRNTGQANVPTFDNGFSLDTGMPGRFDSVFLMEASSTSPGWPVRVHRSYRPYDHALFGWQRNLAQPFGATAAATATGSAAFAFEDLTLLQLNSVFVALDAPAPVPVPFGTAPNATNPNAPVLDSRLVARVLKHPTGERPREVDRVSVGASIRGAQVATSVADELVFGATTFGAPVGRAEQGGQLVLAADAPAGPTQVSTLPQTLRLGLGQFRSPVNYLAALPQRPGLARIGDEYMVYDTFDAANGTFNIPIGGRGLLGSIDSPHELGEAMTLVDSVLVSTLSANVSAEDSTLTLLDVTGFPFQGTVLIDRELIHYTRIVGGALEMPRRSSEAGKMDAQAGGLFRGRFGSQPAGHTAGAAVILFPFRYWDRWAERADAPEMAYFGLCVDQPSALFASAFFRQEEPASGSARVEILQRLVRAGRPAPPWDGDPNTTPGLTLLDSSAERERGHAIGEQADLAEWRAHVRYAPGAFDAVRGVSHGWKQTPRLRVFGVEYLAPGAVLRRVGE